MGYRMKGVVGGLVVLMATGSVAAQEYVLRRPVNAQAVSVAPPPAPVEEPEPPPPPPPPPAPVVTEESFTSDDSSTWTSFFTITGDYHLKSEITDSVVDTFAISPINQGKVYFTFTIPEGKTGKLEYDYLVRKAYKDVAFLKIDNVSSPSFNQLSAYKQTEWTHMTISDLAAGEHTIYTYYAKKSAYSTPVADSGVWLDNLRVTYE